MLQAGNLIGFGAGGGGGGLSLDPPDITVSYVTTVSTQTDGTSATFNSTSIGTPGTNRKIIVVAHTEHNSGTKPVITSITCGGVSMNLTVSSETTVFSSSVAIGALAVASGTTANFVVNCSNTSRGFALHVFKVVGDNINVSSPYDTTAAADSGGLITLDMDWGPAQGGAVFAAAQYIVTDNTTVASLTGGSDGTEVNGYQLINAAVNSDAMYWDAGSASAATIVWDPDTSTYSLSCHGLSVVFR
jgi:hypothetical protein